MLSFDIIDINEVLIKLSYKIISKRLENKIDETIESLDILLSNIKVRRQEKF